MGADFICSTCPLPSVRDTKALSDILDERIGRLSKDKCYELLEQYHHDYQYEVQHFIEGYKLTEDHLFKIDDLEGYFVRKMTEDMLRDALSEVIFEENRRDIAHIMLEHKWWIISGGMSWGDAPTEAMNAIDILDSSGILDGLN